MNTSRSTILALSLALAGAVALAGCASTASSGSAPAPSESQVVVDPPGNPAVAATWMSTRSFLIVGDSASGIAGVEVTGDQKMAVKLVTDGTGTSPEVTHLMGVPAGLDTSKPLEVTVEEADGATTTFLLPAVTGGGPVPADIMLIDEQPAVSWLPGGKLAVLTWGSSSCAPTGGTVAAVDGGPAVITLDQPTDGPCTSDLTSQITVVDASEIAVDSTFVIGADGTPLTPIAKP